MASAILVLEDAPESSTKLPHEKWLADADRDRLVRLLNTSAKAVRDAVSGEDYLHRRMMR